jgi:hypothetical protein
LNVFLNSFLFHRHPAIHPSLVTSRRHFPDHRQHHQPHRSHAGNDHHLHSQEDEECGRWALRGIRVLHFLGRLRLLSLRLLHGPLPLLDVPAITDLTIVRSPPTYSSFSITRCHPHALLSHTLDMYKRPSTTISSEFREAHLLVLHLHHLLLHISLRHCTGSFLALRFLHLGCSGLRSDVQQLS